MSATRSKVRSPDAGTLLDWYDRHRRRLPWRAGPGQKPNPYRVWLSEIMLQQTTVAAVGPYFLRFVEQWPTVEALAAAPQDDVLRDWAGLGYYARARNLHACAKTVAEDLGGRFPDTEEGLRALPGIGAYTAGAIAAIAFDQQAAAVDGNVERVVARLFAIDTPMPAAKTEIRARTADLVPADRPGDFAQAVMDLGATICTPKRPVCALCPWNEECLAHAGGIAESLPVKAPKKDRPLRRGAAFWAERGNGSVLIVKRPPKGLLGGMDGVWLTPLKQDIDPSDAREHAPFKARWNRIAGEVEHVFTHFRLQLTVFTATDVTSFALPDTRWVTKTDLPDVGLPTVMRKAAAHALRALHGPKAEKLVALRRRSKAPN
ncbi:A/G-specific adenine glycosylase [Microbaculum marinisediminis]|uniref:Adenine DNA glycosylase n=1 Tax=Microbaculum marinisediminis TaxID=2931392 RepID=A0AAW5QTV7_9HYPH|nr:A/G-specific adenine glycosylase [Microbaculum sp. A6E488]MCT8970319.1 A/G-specific adenine glycosylase [Microbaculum sp. A6E488]